jgi:purine-binding chemotaxis protein CheW
MADQDWDRGDGKTPLVSLASRRFLTFRVADRRYALPAEDVSEVIPVPPVARLPLSPKCLMGLANLRGAVIPVLDPLILMQREAIVLGATARAIVLAGSAQIALAVERVDSLVSIEAGRIETRQAEPVAEPGEILLGAFQTVGLQPGAEHDVTRILDLPAMLGTAFGARRAPKPELRGMAAPAREATAATAPAAVRLLISFDVAGQDYALALDSVREIIPLPNTISIVPRAEAVLLGVTAWRGSLLPLLSLRGLLGFPLRAEWSGREKVFVTVVNGASVGLVADQARALIRAEATAIDPAPAMLAARSGGEAKIAAIYRGESGKHLVSLLAPDQLFREDVMRRIGGSSVPAAAASGAATPGATLHIVVFRLGDEEFGLPIAAVDEVARVPAQITRVPKMPKFLEGVINLRGEVLPVIDQRRRFDMAEITGGGAQRLIVVRAERHRAGLIVDRVSEVVRADAGAIEAAPELTGDGARLVSGVINDRVAGRMILLLDPSELLTPAEQGALDQFVPGGGAGGSGMNELGEL